MSLTATLTLTLSVLLLSACAAGGQGGAGAPALTFDGLTPLEGTTMQQVWVRKGFSLSGYSKVILESAGIQFRPVTRATGDGLKSAAVPFPLSGDERAEITAVIAREFDRAMDRLALREVNEPGPDVLRVRGSLLDVVVRPAGGTAGARRYEIDSVGQLTFVVELIDSQTSTVLVRAVDTRAARTPGAAYPSSQATDKDGPTWLIGRWADLLVDALNDLTRIDQLQGA